MDRFDPAGEYLQIAERYRQMKDEELLVLMPQISELTDAAQQALANEFRSRGLKVETESEKVSVPAAKPRSTSFERAAPRFANSAGDEAAVGETVDDDAEEEGDSYEEDRELVDLCTVWSERDAVKVQQILDAAGIPFFMGPEKATGVDGVTSKFSSGVAVQVMRIGLPWAAPGMSNYEPEDDPDADEQQEAATKDVSIRCPKCHSTDVVFEGGTSSLVVAAEDRSQKFKWICDACGHQWEDNGIEEEE
jgi:hypothetical protein